MTETSPLVAFENWDGSTYYGRQQLKPWPFQPLVVGSYIFLAGLSGSAQILATIAQATGRRELDGVVRRGRTLALLAPTIGSALLIYDLHTPKRFYNMLRVAKATSPMSIGTWLLVGFSVCSIASVGAQAGADRWRQQRWMGKAATAAGVPAALAGAGLCTYTAALLSATSTPVWAAAPGALAVRFGASSIATGAAALALYQDEASIRGKLDALQAAALLLELAFAEAVKRQHRRVGIESAYDSAAGRADAVGATLLGVALPLGLLAVSALAPRAPRTVSILAGVATLLGSLTLRSAMLSLGTVSASRPDVSFRFSTPKNLPSPRV